MIANRVRHFIAVAKAGAFGRAAVQLGIGQAPLSQSIQRLERELGVLLFDRTPKGVTLTGAGRAYLPEAEIAVAASDRARELARAESMLSPPVRVGVITPALWGPLPSMLEAARRAKVRIELVEGTTDELLDGLFSGRIDFSFVAPPFAPSSRLTTIAVDQEPLVAAMPARTDPPGEPHADLALMAQALILFPRAYGPTLYDAVIGLFRERDLRPHIVVESPRMLTTLALVSAGVGSSIVSPSLARAVAVTNVIYRPFPDRIAAPCWPVSLAFIQPADGTPAARLLTHWMQEHPSKRAPGGRDR